MDFLIFELQQLEWSALSIKVAEDYLETDIRMSSLFHRVTVLFCSVLLYKSAYILPSTAAAEDHSDADCFGCAILSHGDDGTVYGTDSIMQLKTLVDCVKGPNCPSLIGKPKLFFIQVSFCFNSCTLLFAFFISHRCNLHASVIFGKLSEAEDI